MRHAGYPDKCKHFLGIQRPCEAGIDPATVRDAANPGPYRWPCLCLIGSKPASTICEKRELMTIEEHDAEEDMITAAVEAHCRKIDSGECPECGKPIEPSRIVGRCKYAACGHRIGQVLGDGD